MRYLLTGFDRVGSPVYEPIPMITWTYHPQDVYSVAGSTFHTRAEAEAYAAPLIAQGYTARGTAPSYDRTRYTGRPYRLGDAIETDDIDPGFGDEF